MHYQAVLASVQGFGKAIRLLIGKYTPSYIVEKLTVEEMIAAECRPEMAMKFFGALREADPAALLRDLRRCEAAILMPCDIEYPELLRQSPSNPLFLYRRGAACEDARILAVVGSRQISPYGKKVVRTIIPELVSHGFTIVSGLAYGIDAHAHECALDAGGRAVAVLGSGVDQIYPRCNFRLAERILASGGTIYSEYMPGMQPQSFTFPARNRIVAGLSQGVFVAQAGHDSGSLITARFALEANREVFAVPGNIFESMTEGLNQLLSQGAHVVRSVADILQPYEIQYMPASRVADRVRNLTFPEQCVVELIRQNEVTVSSLPSLLNMSMRDASSLLTLLEMKGVVEREGEVVYLK